MGSAVLVLTALEYVTADLVISALNDRETTVVRADPADLGAGLTFNARIDTATSAWHGSLRTTSRTVELGEVAAVYYRRPTPYAARYRQLPAQQRDFCVAEARHGLSGVLNDLRGATYVNHPWDVARAEFKPAQLRLAARLGLSIPPTLVTNCPDEAQDFADEYGHVIYKPFRGLPPGECEQPGAIWAQRVDPDTFDDSLAVMPHLFQAEIDKVGDARVTVVGNRVFASKIQAPHGVLDWRRGNWDDLVHASLTVPPPISRLLHEYLAELGLVFGCFDFGLTGDATDPASWVFIECNPNGQWGWLPDAPAISEAFAHVLNRKEAGSR